MTLQQGKISTRTWTPTELRQLSASERDRILKAAAELAERDYRDDPQLTGFDAFGTEDISGGDDDPSPR